MRNRMLISLAIYLAALAIAVPTLGNHGLWLAMLIFMATRGITLGVGYPAIVRLATGKPASAF